MAEPATAVRVPPGMRDKRRIQVAALAAVASVAGVVATTAVAGGDDHDADARLTGFEEVPAVSTDASGKFRARVRASSEEIQFRLSYSELSGPVQQAHIHFGQFAVNGGITAFLCSNLGNGPAGTQPCPEGPTTVTGTIGPAQVVGPADQGIAPGEFDELVEAIRAGVTYANVHSEPFPGGEIRGQID
jgi:CHRD domain